MHLDQGIQAVPWDGRRDDIAVSEEGHYNSIEANTEVYFNPATMNYPSVDPSIMRAEYAAMTRADDTTTFPAVERHRGVNFQLPSSGREYDRTEVFRSIRSVESGNTRRPSDLTVLKAGRRSR